MGVATRTPVAMAVADVSRRSRGLAIAVLGIAAVIAAAACQPVDSNPNDVVLGVSWICNADHGATYTWTLTNRTSWPVHVDNATFTPLSSTNPAFAPDPIRSGREATAVQTTPGTNPSAEVYVSFTLVGSPTPPVTTTTGGITSGVAQTSTGVSAPLGGVHGTTKFGVLISQSTGCITTGATPTLTTVA